MSLQLPPAEPRREHPVLRRGPKMPVVFVVWGVKTQLKLLTTQAQAVSFGVGGSVVDAKNELFAEGHVGNVADPASDWDGALGPVALVYWVTRRVKSSFGVTVLPETFTMPNSPWADSAGK